MLQNAPVHPTIPTTDIERAKSFYGKTLGLKPVESTPEGLVFEAGKGTFVYVYERPPSRADHTLASFGVKDVEKAMREMREVGVKFEEYDLPNLKTKNGLATIGGIKGAWFRDPDGNILAITELRS